jgi:hypothetical protein
MQASLLSVCLLEKRERVSLGVLLSERVSSSEENVRRREDAVLFWLVGQTDLLNATWD